VNIAVNLCKTYLNISMQIQWKFHQNLRPGDFRKYFSFETKLPVMLLLSEFFFFQCIGNRKLRGLARPLNFIQFSYNFAGFISMSKRNLKSVGQSYLRTFMFLGHTTRHYMTKTVWLTFYWITVYIYIYIYIYTT